LNRDGFGRSIAGVLVPGLLLAAWLVWFLTVPVARYEVTEQARIEADQSTHVIQAPVAGRVVLSNLTLGREVEARDILVAIETDAERLQVKEEEARLAMLEAELKAVRAQMASEAQSARAETQVNVAAVDQSRAQFREADAQGVFADREADRMSRLRRQGLVADREEERAAADARSRRAAAEALTLATARLEREQRRAESERQTTMTRLRGESDRLEAARATARQTIERLRFEVSRRSIVAPVAGRLGEVAVLRVGAFVDEGDTLGAVVPRGSLRIVAEFLPPAALGRIRPGQPAWMRLAGFPWTQYGALRATVQRVGHEVREGRVRVELTVDAGSGAAVPLQHGLPGSVEVQTEMVTAATLALRTAGRLIDRPETQYQ
jgi:membrane fusion protein (multidrug efflux system)